MHVIEGKRRLNNEDTGCFEGCSRQWEEHLD